MATSFKHMLVAVAGLATFYCVVGTSGNARVSDMSPVAHVPAELLQWHSGLTITSDSYVKSGWDGNLGAIDSGVPTAFLVMHGAGGVRDAANDGFAPGPESSGAPKGVRKSARNSTGK